MDTLTLTKNQRRRAKTVLQRLSEGEIEKPTDIVERWEPMPDYEELDTEEHVFDMDTSIEQKYVSVSDIIGTGTGGVDYLQQERLKQILELLMAGEFKRESERPPKFEGVDGNYYVAVDGVHRTLAFKAIGLEKMYVEVIEIPVE
jgi:hypothetical protein